MRGFSYALKKIKEYEKGDRMVVISEMRERMPETFSPDDIVKITKEGKTTLGKVVDSTDTDVRVFRASGDVWYSLLEYEIENLGSCKA